MEGGEEVHVVGDGVRREEDTARCAEDAARVVQKPGNDVRGEERYTALG